MTKNERAALTRIGKILQFKKVIRKLTTESELTNAEKEYILGCAILFTRSYERDQRFSSYVELAYYIILKYSISYNDYHSLYDFSFGFGFYPITKIILNNGLIDLPTLNDCYIDISLDEFSIDSYVQTKHQYTERNGLLLDQSSELLYVAPTSFGKSSIIIDLIQSIPQERSKIAIIVPTKSLLMQTYRMIRHANFGSKIIIHDEMYQDDVSFIAIFTQERALRLMSKANLFFDVLFIDEAHNLLKDDERSILLSRLIAKNRSLNNKLRIVYLSPLVDDAKNIKVQDDQIIKEYKIPFNIKEAEVFEYRMDFRTYKYNRFVNEFYQIGRSRNMFTYILETSLNKNFLYNYRPVKIEELAKELSTYLKKIVQTKKMRDLIALLKREVHEMFFAVDYIEYGIIYLHGKLPDLIKEYLESKFRNLDEMKYIIANSVILEGMNLPIDNLYILNTYKLHGKDLTNLIGRVNRLNTIFTREGNNLQKLLPPVHFINSSNYNSKKGNMSNKIALLRSRTFQDTVENCTLNEFNVNKLSSNQKTDAKQKEYRFIQQNENFLTKSPVNQREKLMQYLLETGISMFYSDLNKIVNTLTERIADVIRKPNSWIRLRMSDKIYHLFLKDIDYVKDFEFARLKYEEARNYYEHHMTVAKKRSLKQNIVHLFNYFKKTVSDRHPKTYFGSSYGEIPADSENPHYQRNDYVDLSKKSDSQMINLAIVKLKMEDDFVSFKLNKFIIMLHDYELIDHDEYNSYIYGTTDQNKIDLTKIGLSMNLISRLDADSQLRNIYIDEHNNLKSLPELEEFKNGIDDLYRFEIERFLG